VRLPLDPLLIYLDGFGNDVAFEARYGFPRRSLCRYRQQGWLTVEAADRLCTALGLHVFNVYPQLAWHDTRPARPERACARCGEPFEPRAKTHIYCSHRCARNAYAARRREKSERARAYDRAYSQQYRAQYSEYVRAYRREYYRRNSEREKARERARYWADPERARARRRKSADRKSVV